ncbi:dTDP-4-dehydrorhamnose reductase [Phytoactinopolyspora limicola]|uniref:dTDP-4-dehydrorhamnose reductase n=1 Tax=Phytoactinopolyspora limicola TaxID=2715536 RepID=UPI001408D56B|nr:dTDP-4-dehydrorhamnose reductase [Phytoactinopolyspora limicola]
MTRWLVTGASGLLGRDLVPLLPPTHTTAPTSSDVDVRDERRVFDAIAGHDVVVHLAAWVDPDRAEAEPDRAMAINAAGTENVARACRAHHARLIYVSSDYVFDGRADHPYQEDAPTHPICVYGRSKVAAEQAVRRHLPDDGIVLRTAWLYGAYGRSFVATMRRLADEGTSPSVVTDQTGQPTWARDVAQRILEVVRVGAPAGTYHATNGGATSWYQLARTVFAALGHDPDRVRPMTSDRLDRAAPRPAYSALSHAGWARAGLRPLRPWREAFDAAVPVLF